MSNDNTDPDYKNENAKPISNGPSLIIIILKRKKKLNKYIKIVPSVK